MLAFLYCTWSVHNQRRISLDQRRLSLGALLARGVVALAIGVPVGAMAGGKATPSADVAVGAMAGFVLFRLARQPAAAVAEAAVAEAAVAEALTEAEAGARSGVLVVG